MVRNDESLEIFHFKWEVAKSTGYEISYNVEVASEVSGILDKTPPFLIEKHNNSRLLTTFPLRDKPELFAEFAYLIEKQDIKTAVLEFANNHGWLGVTVPLFYKEKAESELFQGESLNVWKSEIEEMFCLVNLWLLLKDIEKDVSAEDNAKKELAKHIKWEKVTQKKESIWEQAQEYMIVFESGQLLPKSKMRRLLTSPQYRQEFQTIGKGNFAIPVRLLLLDSINKRLRGNASPCVLFNRSYMLDGYIRPHNLLAALWLQFYHAITGVNKFKKCELCKKPMSIEGKREDTKRHTRCYEREKKKKQRKGGQKNG